MVILWLVCISIFYTIFAIVTTYLRYFTKICMLANHYYFINNNSHYLSSIAIVSKHCYNNLEVTYEAFIALFKKKRSETNLLPNLNQYQKDHNKLNTTNISNIEDDY